MQCSGAENEEVVGLSSVLTLQVCANCGVHTAKRCACRFASYCSKTCQQKHRSNHSTACTSAVSRIRQESAVARNVTGQASVLWVVDSNAWKPVDGEIDAIIDRYCHPSRADKIRKFRFESDRKRALISTLLQRKACIEIDGCDPSSVKILLTKGSKPYSIRNPSSKHPNFCFNASHEGDYVVLCAHSHYLCGVDTIHIEADRQKVEFLESCLTEESKAYLATLCSNVATCWLQLMFGCKEAYTKAVGVGLFEEYVCTVLCLL